MNITYLLYFSNNFNQLSGLPGCRENHLGSREGSGANFSKIQGGSLPVLKNCLQVERVSAGWAKSVNTENEIEWLQKGFLPSFYATQPAFRKLGRFIRDGLGRLLRGMQEVAEYQVHSGLLRRMRSSQPARSLFQTVLLCMLGKL